MIEGNYDGGTTIRYGLEDNSIGLAPSTDKNVSQDIIDYVNKKINQIINKEIEVPSK